MRFGTLGKTSDDSRRALRTASPGTSRCVTAAQRTDSSLCAGGWHRVIIPSGLHADRTVCVVSSAGRMGTRGLAKIQSQLHGSRPSAVSEDRWRARRTCLRIRDVDRHVDPWTLVVPAPDGSALGERASALWECKWQLDEALQAASTSGSEDALLTRLQIHLNGGACSPAGGRHRKTKSVLPSGNGKSPGLKRADRSDHSVVDDHLVDPDGVLDPRSTSDHQDCTPAGLRVVHRRDDRARQRWADSSGRP